MRRGRRADVISAVVVAVLTAGIVLGIAALNWTPRPPSGTSFAAPASTTPPKATYVAWFGDSFTIGTGAYDKHHRFPTLVSTAFGWTEENFGAGGTGYTKVDKVNGGPFDAFVAHMKATIPATYAPSIVIVSGGRNDGLYQTGQAGYEATVQKTFRDIRAAEPQAKIIALPQTWGVRRPVPEKFPYEVSVIKHAVEAVGGQYIDLGYPLLGQTQYDARDHIHVNDSGYVAYSQAIVDAFLKAGVAKRIVTPLPDPALYAGKAAPAPPSTTAPASAPK